MVGRPAPRLPINRRPILPIMQLTDHRLDLKITIPTSLINTMGQSGMRDILTSLQIDATRRINTQLSLLAERATYAHQQRLQSSNQHRSQYPPQPSPAMIANPVVITNPAVSSMSNSLILQVPSVHRCTNPDIIGSNPTSSI